MITFFYEESEKTIYLYNAGIEVAKIWEVLRVEKDTKINKFFFYCGENNGGVIMGLRVFNKL
jgi:hypothetical protein